MQTPYIFPSLITCPYAPAQQTAKPQSSHLIGSSINIEWISMCLSLCIFQLNVWKSIYLNKERLRSATNMHSLKLIMHWAIYSLIVTNNDRDFAIKFSKTTAHPMTSCPLSMCLLLILSLYIPETHPQSLGIWPPKSYMFFFFLIYSRILSSSHQKR